MRIQIHKDNRLIVDATLPDDKDNLEILRKIAIENLKIKEELKEKIDGNN